MPHGMTGCEPVTEWPPARLSTGWGAPVTSGMLSPTRNMKRNETPVEARCSAGVSMWRWRMTMPVTKAGSSTSMWMLCSGP